MPWVRVGVRAVVIYSDDLDLGICISSIVGPSREITQLHTQFMFRTHDGDSDVSVFESLMSLQMLVDNV